MKLRLPQTQEEEETFESKTESLLTWVKATYSIKHKTKNSHGYILQIGIALSIDHCLSDTINRT